MDFIFKPKLYLPALEAMCRNGMISHLLALFGTGPAMG